MAVYYKRKDVAEIVKSGKIPKRLPQNLKKVIMVRLGAIEASSDINDLRIPPGNRLEALKGDMKGYHSIRINRQWRVVFRWVKPDFHEVDIVDYHS